MGYFYEFNIIGRKWISVKVESCENGIRRKWNSAKVEYGESGKRRKWKFEFPIGEILLVESGIRRKWMNPTFCTPLDEKREGAQLDDKFCNNFQ